MRLLLVRHAKAFDPDSAAWPDDERRPLTAAGRAAFARLAKRLGHILPEVDALLASPATRAWQTARLLHENTAWPEPQREELLRPADSLAALAKLAALLPADAGATVVCVGHEPALSRFASWLLVGDAARLAIDLKKGAALLMEVPAATIREPAGTARLHWLLTPQIARRWKKPS